MAYGELKVDSITFTDNGTDTTVSVSGLVQNPTFSGNITVTGTISGSVVQGGVTVSGATVTGSAGEFDTITGNTAGFTTITGTTVTGSTANFVSGTFTTQVSGATVTGNLAQFTTITGGTAGFTTVTGTTVTGSAGQFGTVTGNTAGFTTVTGTTVTGTTASFTSGVFTNISGGTHTITSGVFDDGTAAAPSITFTGDLDTGIYSPGANQVAISTNGTGRLFVNSEGRITLSNSDGIQLSAKASSLYTTDGSLSYYGTTNGVYLTGAGPNGNLSLYAAGSESSRNAIIINASAGSGGPDTIQFRTAASERLRIDSSGKLLVGTPSARSNFAGVSSPIIQSTGGFSQPSIGLVTGDGATIPRSYLIFGRTADGGTGNTLVGNNFNLGSISFQGADGSNLVPAAEISAAVDGTPGASDMPGRLVFSTTADGASGPTERMRIDSSGRLGLGTSSPQERLDVAGNGASFLRWEHDGANGSYNTSGGVLRIGPYFAATDRELALFVDNSNAAWITTGTTEVLNIGTNKTSRIYIDGTGKVGVGTTTPAAGINLDVAGKIRTSTGILFGSDTAAANTLDDYEEGTWTPAFSFATPGDLAVTYSSQTGNYRIVGKLCIATFTLEFTPTYTTSSGTARVTGLPLSTGNYLTTPASVDRFSGFTLTAGFDNMWLRKNTGQTYIELYSMGRSGSSAMGTSQVVSGSAKILNGTIIYNL